MTTSLTPRLTARLWAIAERTRAQMDQGDPGTFPADAFRLLAGDGLLTLPLHPDLGGQGLGLLPGSTGALLDLLAILGWGDLSVARLYEGHVDALLLVQRLGTPEQARRAAADASRGLIFGVWNTEGPDGLRLTGVDGPLRLLGGKTFASGAGSIERPLVTARDDVGGWQLIQLEMERVPARIIPGSWNTFGMRASRSFAIDLGGTPIEPRQCIGADGDYYRQPWFSGGAIRFCAAQLGGAAALLDLARAELQARNRDGDPLQQSRIGTIASQLSAGFALLGRTASQADRSRFAGGSCDDDDAFLAAVGLTRSAVERICLETLEAVERSLGAGSLLATHPAGRIAADLRLYLRQPAPDAALLAAAGFLLSTPRPFMQLWPTLDDTSHG